HTFQPGQVTRRRSVSARGRFRRRIDGIDVEILVAVVVLYIKDELAVTGPEVSRDRTLNLGRQQAGGAKRLIHALHIDVAGVLPRLEEGDVLPVGRDLRASNLRIAKEDLAVDHRRQ